MSSVSGDPSVIVVGVDGSAESAAALSWAIDEARLRQAGLNIVHAFPALVSFFGTTAHEYYPQVEKDARDQFAAILAAAPPMDGLDVTHTVVPGNPAEVLVNESHGATLLVVGSTRPRRLSRHPAGLGVNPLHPVGPLPGARRA